jgi:addiction module HigA family antidote
MAIITDGKMHGPAQPGDILRKLYLEPMGISATRLADAVQVSRKHISAIINGRAAISTDLAVRLGLALGTDTEVWLNLQKQWDLWEMSQRAKPNIRRLTAA